MFRSFRTFSNTPDGRGFTLMEVMVALAILALSLLSVMSLFSQGVRMNQAAEEYTLASLLAKSKMGEVLMVKEMDGTTTNGTFDEFDGKYGYEVKVEEYEIDYLKEEEEGLDFDATRTQGAGGQTEPDYKVYKVDVSVIWGDEGRKRLTLTSLRTDYVLPEGGDQK